MKDRTMERARNTLTSLDKIIEVLKEMQPEMKSLADGMRHPSDEELLDKALNLGLQLNELNREMKHKFPSKFDSSLEQNIDLVHDVLNNLAAIRMFYSLGKENT